MTHHIFFDTVFSHSDRDSSWPALHGTRGGCLVPWCHNLLYGHGLFPMGRQDTKRTTGKYYKWPLCDSKLRVTRFVSCPIIPRRKKKSFLCVHVTSMKTANVSYEYSIVFFLLSDNPLPPHPLLECSLLL